MERAELCLPPRPCARQQQQQQRGTLLPILVCCVVCDDRDVPAAAFDAWAVGSGWGWAVLHRAVHPEPQLTQGETLNVSRLIEKSEVRCANARSDCDSASPAGPVRVLSVSLSVRLLISCLQVVLLRYSRLHYIRIHVLTSTVLSVLVPEYSGQCYSVFRTGYGTVIQRVHAGKCEQSSPLE